MDQVLSIQADMPTPEDVRLLHTEIDRLTKEVDRLRVQLAGCGVAALDGSSSVECPRDGYGWSPAYADVLALRRCMDAVRSEIGVSLADYDAAGYDAHAATLNVLRAQTIRA
jgi:hypothetical protein